LPRVDLLLFTYVLITDFCALRFLFNITILHSLWILTCWWFSCRLVIRSTLLTSHQQSDDNQRSCISTIANFVELLSKTVHSVASYQDWFITSLQQSAIVSHAYPLSIIPVHLPSQKKSKKSSTVHA